MLLLAVTGYLSDLEKLHLIVLDPNSPHLPHRAAARG